MGATSEAGFWSLMGGAIAPMRARHPFAMQVVDAEPERGELEFAFAAKAEHADAAGRIKKGYLCAMLDDAMDTTLSAICGPHQSVSSIDMRVQYVHPGLPGGFAARARIVSRVPGAVTVEGEIFQNARLVARAIGTSSVQERTH